MRPASKNSAPRVNKANRALTRVRLRDRARSVKRGGVSDRELEGPSSRAFADVVA